MSKKLILASASPRRQYLLKSAGYSFTVENATIDEDYPPELSPGKVGEYLAIKKANAFLGKAPEAIVIAADTVVVHQNKILGKPLNAEQAYRTLEALSGDMHEVITGVAFLCDGIISSFHDISKVFFKRLSDWEIQYYVQHYKPYDKAGGYGIQEWIGMTGIEKIEGSFFNVMGLPIHRVHEFLQKFRIEEPGYFSNREESP